MAVEQSSQGVGVLVAGLISAQFAENYASYVGDLVPAAGAIQFTCGFLFMSLLAGWIVRDSWMRGKRRPYDFDTLVAILWILLAPLYLLKTRRWRGALILVLAIVVSALVEVAAWSLSNAAWEKSS